MSHYEKEEWILYMNNHLLISERVEYEEHLYTCDICLAIYMECIEEHGNNLPSLDDGPSFAEQVVALSIFQQPKIQSKAQSKMQTLFQYAVAAGITLMLMTSGVFNELTENLSNLNRATSSERTAPVSDQWVDRALSFLDTIQMNYKGGENIE